MTIRDLNLEDLRKLENHRNGFPMPNVCNPNYFLQLAIEDDEQLLGICFVKMTTETILIFDRNISKLKKMKAWLKLAARIESEGQSRNLDDTHVFLSGDKEDVENYEKLLLKLGFVRATGTPMYYSAGDGLWRKNRQNRAQV